MRTDDGTPLPVGDERVLPQHCGAESTGLRHPQLPSACADSVLVPARAEELPQAPGLQRPQIHPTPRPCQGVAFPAADRKSTRLNSSHVSISYAVFRLKKTTGP